MTRDRLPRMLGLFSLTVAVPVMATVVTVAQAPAPNPGEVTFTRDIAPILQRSCQKCHRPDSVAPDVADHLRGGTTVGPGHEDADRPAVAAGRDAALVHREEHRDPEIQGRPVAQRRGDREDCEMGRQRRTTRAIRPTCRRHVSSTHRRVDDRGTRSRAAIGGRHGSCCGPDRWADLGLVPTGLTEDRYVAAVEVREINDIPRAARPIRWAVGTCFTT